MDGHDTQLRHFIRSDKSPDGDWWLNFPVGFRGQERGDIPMGGTKEIDAVCVTSREHDEPELYKWNYQQLVNSDRIISQSAYKTMWDEKEFAGEAVSIVEVKSDSPNWEGVGQLVGYKELIMDEWDVFVPDMYLVASDKDPVIERACERLGIDSVSTNL